MSNLQLQGYTFKLFVDPSFADEEFLPGEWSDVEEAYTAAVNGVGLPEGTQLRWTTRRSVVNDLLTVFGIDEHREHFWIKVAQVIGERELWLDASRTAQE